MIFFPSIAVHIYIRTLSIRIQVCGHIEASKIFLTGNLEFSFTLLIQRSFLSSQSRSYRCHSWCLHQIPFTNFVWSSIKRLMYNNVAMRNKLRSLINYFIIRILILTFKHFSWMGLRRRANYSSNINLLYINYKSIEVLFNYVLVISKKKKKGKFSMNLSISYYFFTSLQY